MNALKLENSVLESANKNGKMPVIIVAAGKASRMQGIDKQFVSLGGMPVIARTLTAFQKSPLISKIIVVTKEESLLNIQHICSEYLIDKVSDITVGGNSRTESVICGMKCLDSKDEKVLIHDGARPFVSDKIIADCVLALAQNDGCLCAVKVTDTVKKSCGEDFCKETVSRENLYFAQTPQGVNVSYYLKAYEEFKDKTFTDDVSLLEVLGKTVKIVAGDKKNIKITTREDLLFANAILNTVEKEV